MNIFDKRTILIFFIIILCLSLAANGWLAYMLFQSVSIFRAQQIDIKVLSFMNMFVEDVLMAKKEIDFDTRLSLETAVRNLDDQKIFDQWQRFTKCETKEDASEQAKILLDLLVKKVNTEN